MKAVDMVQKGPLYNITRLPDDLRWNHVKISVDDMKAMLSLCREVVKESSRGQCFVPRCSLPLSTNC